jgi:hypothetical protein
LDTHKQQEKIEEGGFQGHRKEIEKVIEPGKNTKKEKARQELDARLFCRKILSYSTNRNRSKYTHS